MTLENREISAAEIHRLPLSGRMQAEQDSDLKEHFDCDYRTIILDLRELRLADRDAVRFLRGCKSVE
jgi:hypothetical protein